MSNFEKRDLEAWQTVCDVEGERVRRFSVPGGWLYQVEMANYTEQHSQITKQHVGWHSPVFVARGVER